jgi:UPF0755 protein
MKKNTWIILSLVAAIFLAVIGFCIKQYYHFSVSNFLSYDHEAHAYKVYPDMTTDSLMSEMLGDYEMFSELAWCIHSRHLKFTNAKPGYYRFGERIANRELIHRLQCGEESPIKLSFTHALHTPEQVAGHMGQRLLLDSAEVIERLQDKEYLSHFGLTPETAVCLFIPNTYEVYWTMTTDQLFARMYKEYQRFWNEDRLAKAEKLGLTPMEVATLASIVASETNRKEEHSTIASLYLNRLRKGIALQACPTVIFATGDFTLRRVLKRHLAIESPYNTYKHRGLPPGPIRLARPDVIDAVLNAPKTDYLYMCANPDFSGTHIFSSSYAKHSAVAREYQRALNQRKVR